MERRKVRVRFAPSPTGPLHIGGVRTALYNYLFARNQGGSMILRIEDTDQNRYVPGAEQYIIDSLEWCGIKFDEGVHIGGPFAPYRQSERKDIYRKYAEQLIQSGNAYYAFDTAEELESIRNSYEKEKKIFTYDSHTRLRMKNSLNLNADEVEQRLQAGEAYVVRFRIPENESLEFSDLIRGELKVGTHTLDDKVLFKSDGMPTYHLANVVDDHLMEISHVIRGEEWLPSLPLHVLLYRSFGWESPVFAHLPLILKPEGSGKLSKRDGDRLGFPVFPTNWKDPDSAEVYSGYRESGYFPEAVINMLALLGWNPGTEQEIFSMDELISNFSLERVGKSGSRFDPDKARWFNHQYLVKKSDAELAKEYLPILLEKGISAEVAYIEKIVGLIKERANFVKDFWEQSFFFFTPPEDYDPGTVKKRWKEQTPVILRDFGSLLGKQDELSSEIVHSLAENFCSEREIGMGQLMTPLRLCIVGGNYGPDLSVICGFLGKDEVISRIGKALAILPV